MKKLLALILVLALSVFMLSGCMAIKEEIVINADGSTAITAFAGYTEEGLEMIMSAMGAEDTAASVEQFKAEAQAIEYNGIKYYGKTEQKNYATVEEYNQAIEEETTDSYEKLEKHADGSFTYTITLTGDELKDELEGAGYDDAQTEEIIKEMYAAYEITFPQDVKQIAGTSDGITISGNKIIIDVVKIVKSIKDATTFIFTTSKASGFTDVLPEAWYYAAVTKMAQGGLVNGVGNNLFMPEVTLTYAQFCQIMARAKGIGTGEINNYWAGKAVEGCVNAGYIISRGEITPENYDVAIPREAAVAAMYLAKKDIITVTNTLTIADIPDGDKISPEYKEAVLAAYNTGITQGVDENRTFNPDKTLRRAEVCQLFFNLDWTTAAQ